MPPATTTGTLKHGLAIGDTVHKEFELRQCTGADYFAAEDHADSSKQVTYNAALVAQQLVRIGTFTGPFTLGMLGKMHPGDLMAMTTARAKLEVQGEDEQSG